MIGESMFNKELLCVKCKQKDYIVFNPRIKTFHCNIFQLYS